MRLLKPTKPIYYKDRTAEEVIDELNSKFPIDIRYQISLVNRIHDRYPFISKADVSLIVLSAFQSIRDFLIRGKVISFYKVFTDLKFYVFDHVKKGRTFPAIKVRVSTPKNLKRLSGVQND